MSGTLPSREELLKARGILGVQLQLLNLYGETDEGGQPLVWEFERLVKINFDSTMIISRHLTSVKSFLKAGDNEPRLADWYQKYARLFLPKTSGVDVLQQVRLRIRAG